MATDSNPSHHHPDDPGRVSPYVDREGNRITKMQWQHLRASPVYRMVRHYNNHEGVRIYVVWTGHAGTPYEVFEPGLEIYGHGTLQSALNHYEDFLARRCGATWFPGTDGTPYLYEKGNLEPVLMSNTPAQLRDAVLREMVEHEDAGSW